MWRILLVIMLVGGVAVTGSSHVRSAALASQLGDALAAEHLEAVAAADPDDPTRFVAGLLIPKVQLLVVTARYAAPELLHAKLAERRYRDVYLDLQGAAVPDSDWFVQDMGADGLCLTADQSADLVYAGRAAPVVFDADWKSRKMPEREYREQLTTADERYSRLLEILIARLDAGEGDGATR